MRRMGFVVLMVVMVSGLVALGCGGDSDAGTSSNTGSTAAKAASTSVETSDLTKKEFLRKANSICARDTEQTLGRLDAYAKAHPELANDRRSFGKSVKAVVPTMLEQQIERIAALGAPAGDEEQVEAFLAALQADTETLADEPPLKSPDELGPQFEDSSRLAQRYGLVLCIYA